MGLKAWADARKTCPGALEIERRLLEPPTSAAAWSVDAWATAACWSALLDHFDALAVAAHQGDPETCGIQIQHIDRSLQAIGLLLAEIPVAGAASCAQAVELMRDDFGTGAMPDPELMDQVGDWIATAMAAGNNQDQPVVHPAT